MPTRIQIELPWETGLPEDVSVNTWHSGADPDSVPDFTPIGEAFIEFYQAIDEYFSGVLSRDLRMKVYDLSDPEPRTPRGDVTTADVLADAGGPNLPSEMAVCLSTHALEASGTAAGRRRGRVYLGPLNTGVLGTSSGGTPHVQEPVRTDILEAAEALGLDCIAAGMPLAIYSRADNAFRQIRRFSMDDALDVQRRRGERATIRQYGANLF